MTIVMDSSRITIYNLEGEGSFHWIYILVDCFNSLAWNQFKCGDW